LGGLSGFAYRADGIACCGGITTGPRAHRDGPRWPRAAPPPPGEPTATTADRDRPQHPHRRPRPSATPSLHTSQTADPPCSLFGFLVG